MKRRSENMFPWLVALLPAATGALAWYGAQWYPTGEAPDAEAYLQALLPVMLGTFVVSAVLGAWSYTALRRCRERVQVRENALRDFNATQEERVREATLERHRREKTLLQHAKMAAMEDAAVLIAQQWEAPFQALADALASGRALAAGGNCGDAAEAVGAAEKRVGEMGHALEDVRTLFRPDETRERVALSEALAQALQLLGGTLASHGITLETHFDCSVTLPLYRNAFVQVLFGVVQNAKEVLVAREVALPRIGIECYETGQFIVIRISDNAGGVDASAEARIFEPFFTTKRGRRNAGLGLYMARNIVEEHFNGELTFDNLGEGACFYIKLGKHQEETDI